MQSKYLHKKQGLRADVFRGSETALMSAPGLCLTVITQCNFPAMTGREIFDPQGKRHWYPLASFGASLGNALSNRFKM
jgi:hypothetical protein